jgi:hypothetical protein
MCRMPIEPAGERLYDPRAEVEHSLRRMKPCSVGDDGRGEISPPSGSHQRPCSARAVAPRSPSS